MPFVKQTALTIRRPRNSVRDRFIGRASELHMFREHVLKPEDPAYNVLSVWGQAGVGKTTLLARLRDEARTADFNDSCLTALVDERFFTPADLMERCAAQLRLPGAPLAAFEQVATRYKQALQPRHDEQTVARAAFLREVAALTEAKVIDESILGGLYETVAREANASFGNQRSASLPDPLDDLTRAFVDDLNWLSTPSSHRAGRRVILFFDTCASSAAETVTRLHHAVLRVPISNQVVLVVAGREPIDRSLPGGQPVYSMPLAPFTEDETRTYLAEHGMTAADPIATIWQLSGGLPLSVGMLAGDQGRHIDVTADIVTNMLRMIRIGDAPLRLRRAVRGIDLVELPGDEECCGFGGTFAQTSLAMLSDKLHCILDTRAEVCAAVVTSCLMHIDGALHRQRADVRTVHIAEILASTGERSLV